MTNFIQSAQKAAPRQTEEANDSLARLLAQRVANVREGATNTFKKGMMSIRAKTFVLYLTSVCDVFCFVQCC